MSSFALSPTCSESVFPFILEFTNRSITFGRIEPTTKNTDEIWDRIKVLLAPSLWHEAWGIVVTEAQLRGIPVIASNAGGLPEAKIGLPYCIPVKEVTGERHPNGDYVVQEQDIAPWVEALNKVMTDREAYESLADLTATKASEWLCGLDEHAHEKWLLSLTHGKDQLEAGEDSDDVMIPAAL